MRKCVIVLFVMAAFSYVAFADTWRDTSTGITWAYTVSGGKATIGTGATYSRAVDRSVAIGEVSVPATLGGCPVTGVGDYAFYNCDQITSIVLPSGVASVGAMAFYLCSAVQSVAVPDTVQTIGSDAFGYCSELKAIDIPASVTNIAACAFRGCSKLDAISVDAGNSRYCMSDGVLYNKAKTVAVRCSSGKSSATIADGVTNILSGAFHDCQSISTVSLPESVSVIGDESFSGCSSLETIKLPNAICTVGERQFYCCDALTTVEIPSNVTSVGDAAFWGCSALTNVIFDGDAPVVQSGTFFQVNKGCMASVYNDTNGWDDDGDGKWNGLTLKWRGSRLIPDLGDDATKEQIAGALEGSVDTRLAVCITDAANYNAYRTWAANVKTADGSSKAGAQAVKESGNAWFSFAVGSDRLIAELPTTKDIKVDAFAPSSESGKFDFTVSVDGVNVSDEALKENLKQVFGLEGSTTLDTNGFSSDNIDIDFGTPKDGKVKFTAGPKNADTGSFFMRVKMK